MQWLTMTGTLHTFDHNSELHQSEYQCIPLLDEPLLDWRYHGFPPERATVMAILVISVFKLQGSTFSFTQMARGT